MKPFLESLHTSALSSFLVRKFDEKNFSAPYHFHPEYELTFILNGKGKRYAGTNMQDFYPGDFVLLGSNLPHCWKNEKPKGKEKVSSIVIQFQKDFLGNDFFEKPEMIKVASLLQKSSNGLHFTVKTEWFKHKMLELSEEKNTFTKMIFLLQLLNELSVTKSHLILHKQKPNAKFSITEQQRIHAVTAYIIDNFKNEVSLTAAAALINMTPQSFCKYFKRLTRKTFIEAVTDYRVDYAAQQLIQTEHSISQVSFDSGFNDLSHFHKIFKTRMELSPLCYRNTFLQKLEYDS